MHKQMREQKKIVVNSGKGLMVNWFTYRLTLKSTTVLVDVRKTNRLKAMEVTIIYITAN